MRQYLFRGKRVEDGEWVEGDLANGCMGYELGKVFVFCGNGDRHEVIPETVGQYTGLNDKDGVKIWEGDVISRLEGEREQQFEIVWNNEYAEFEPVMHSTDWRPILQAVLTSPCKVVGNIHDNPDLLK